MTSADRKTLIAILQRSNMEAVVRELSSICATQEFHSSDDEGAKLWRSVELKLDRLANSLPLSFMKQPIVTGE